MKFRKKPVEIDAIRWDGQNPRAVFELLGDGELPAAPDDGHVKPGFGHVPALGTLDIPTLEGTMTAQPGDWIIKGVKGELYPCKPDIFEATYEQVGEAPDIDQADAAGLA
jgi:hypothetical protein